MDPSKLSLVELFGHARAQGVPEDDLASAYSRDQVLGLLDRRPSSDRRPAQGSAELAAYHAPSVLLEAAASLTLPRAESVIRRNQAAAGPGAEAESASKYLEPEEAHVDPQLVAVFGAAAARRMHSRSSDEGKSEGGKSESGKSRAPNSAYASAEELPELLEVAAPSGLAEVPAGTAGAPAASPSIAGAPDVPGETTPHAAAAPAPLRPTAHLLPRSVSVSVRPASRAEQSSSRADQSSASPPAASAAPPLPRLASAMSAASCYTTPFGGLLMALTARKETQGDRPSRPRQSPQQQQQSQPPPLQPQPQPPIKRGKSVPKPAPTVRVDGDVVGDGGQMAEEDGEDEDEEDAAAAEHERGHVFGSPEEDDDSTTDGGGIWRASSLDALGSATSLLADPLSLRGSFSRLSLQGTLRAGSTTSSGGAADPATGSGDGAGRVGKGGAGGESTAYDFNETFQSIMEQSEVTESSARYGEPIVRHLRSRARYESRPY